MRGVAQRVWHDTSQLPRGAFGGRPGGWRRRTQSQESTEASIFLSTLILAQPFTSRALAGSHPGSATNSLDGPRQVPGLSWDCFLLGVLKGSSPWFLTLKYSVIPTLRSQGLRPSEFSPSFPQPSGRIPPRCLEKDLARTVFGGRGEHITTRVPRAPSPVCDHSSEGKDLTHGAAIRRH